MKAYQVQNNAGIDALTLVELSEPQLNAGQVLIESEPLRSTTEILP